MLGVAVLAAFVSCKKETPAADVLELLSTPETVITKDGTDTPLTVTFKATKAWTASVDADFATITPKSGDPADECKVKINVAANETTANRSFTVTLKSEGVTPVTVTFNQESQLHMTIDPLEFSVTKDGGEFIINVDANVEFTVTDYSDGSFPWQHAVPANDGKSYKVTIDANNSYNARESYVKFVTTEIKDEEDKDLTVRVYFEQDCLPSVKYSISMYDAEFDTWGTTALSNAVFNGKHYVSNGQDLYEIDPATGNYSKISWPWGSGMTQRVITNDDAGNLIVCNHTAYLNDAYTDGYFILNVVTPAGVESNLITKAAWECGGPFGGKIAVTGDVTSNAVICAPVEGIVDVTGSNSIGCWEVTNGTVGEYNKIAVTGVVCIGWMPGNWCVYPTNCPQFIPQGVHVSDGFLMSGCYEENTVYAVAPNGEAIKMLTPELMVDVYDLNGNLGCQSIGEVMIGSDVYVGILGSPFFPSYGPGWSGAPYLSIFKVPATLPSTPLNMWEDANVVKICTSYFPWEDDPATDWGIDVFADIKLYNADGKISVTVADLNGRCIEAYEFDPEVIKK